MRKYHRTWQIALACILAGCGQREPAKTTPENPASAPKAVTTESSEATAKAPTANEPNTGTAQTAKASADALPAKPAAPASLAEAARVIDLRTFPMLDSEKTLHKTASNVAYQLAKADLTEGAKFYRAKLAEGGWKIGDDYFDKDKGYFSSSWSKDGYMLRLNIVKTPDSGKLTVFAENMGNVDARTLPRPAGAELKQPVFYSTIFRTDDKPEDVVKFIRAELAKLGWRLLRDDGAPESDTGESQYFQAIQRGITINASVEKKKGKTEVMYGVNLLKEELPIMPEVLGAIEFRDEPLLFLKYVAKSGADNVLDYYRKELTALGWTLRVGTDKIDQGKATVLWDAPEKEPIQLVLVAINEGHTAVGVAREKTK